MSLLVVLSNVVPNQFGLNGVRLALHKGNRFSFLPYVACRYSRKPVFVNNNGTGFISALIQAISDYLLDSQTAGAFLLVIMEDASGWKIKIETTAKTSKLDPMSYLLTVSLEPSEREGRAKKLRLAFAGRKQTVTVRGADLVRALQQMKKNIRSLGTKMYE